MCTGEVITSFRQLLKRFSYVGRISSVTTAATTSNAGTTGSGFVIFPWTPVMPQNGAFTVNAAGAMTPTYNNNYTWYNNGNRQVTDNYSNLYSMYSFFRGSIRYKISLASKGSNFDFNLPVYIYINTIVNPILETWSPGMQVNAAGPTNLTTGPLQPLVDDPKLSTTTLKGNYAYQPGIAEARMVVYPSLEGIIEFEVPFHASGHMCPTNYGINDATSLRSIFFPFPTVTITGTPTPNGNTFTNCSFDVFRAIGDDFSFGGLLGAPSQALWYSANNPV